MKLSDYIGTTILALIPGIDQRKIQKIKLRDVESTGIWIENQGLINAFLESVGQPTAPKTLVVFLPYSSITAIYVGVDEPSLNEKAFGV